MLSALFLGQEIAEGKSQDKGEADHDPFGAGKDRPDKKLKGCLFEILQNKEKPERNCQADYDNF